MKVDSSLLIENPWAVAGICYLALLVSLTIITIVGSLISYLFTTGKAGTYGLFVRMLVGLSVTTVSYALVRSVGQTALVPLLIFGIATLRVGRKSSNGTRLAFSEWLSKKQVLMLIGFSATTALLFLTLLLNFKTGELRFLGAGESAQFIDFPFTVRAGQLLNLGGIESISTNFFDTSQLRPTPYHWLEIWFGALIYQVFPFNAEVLWSCVVNPVLFTILLIGFTGLIERIVGEKPYLFLGSFLILFISGFGVLYPTEIPFFSATLRAESLLETPKYVIAYLFAIPVVEGLFNDRKDLLPYLFVLFGLSYLPIIPVGSMLAFVALLLHIWSLRNDRKKAATAFANWTTFYLLLAAWFYWYYSNSQISYTAGAGASSGVLKTFDPVLSTKVFGHMLIQVFLTNMPYILILFLLVFSSLGWRQTLNSAKKNANSLMLLAVFYPASVLGYVMIYGMTNSVQVWTVSYQSLHYIILACLLVYALCSKKIMVKAFAATILILAVGLKFHVDLGAGNELNHNQLTGLNQFISAEQPETIKFAYIGDARYGNDGAGGLFDLVTDIFYPVRELGILTTPYANASLSVFDIPLSNNPEQRAKQQRILSHGPFYQYVGKQTNVDALQPVQLSKFKVKFIKEFRVNFIIVPFDQELSTELIPLVGESIEVKDCTIYKVL